MATRLPVTVAATRRARPGSEVALERWAHQLCSAAAESPGYQRSDVRRATRRPHQLTVTLTFASAEAAAIWENSERRSELVARCATLTEGELIPGTPAPPSPPGRMRTALVVWLGLTPFALLLNTLGATALAALPVVPRTLVTTVVLVPLAVFVGIPLVNRTLTARSLRRSGRGRTLP